MFTVVNTRDDSLHAEATFQIGLGFGNLLLYCRRYQASRMRGFCISGVEILQGSRYSAANCLISKAEIGQAIGSTVIIVIGGGFPPSLNFLHESSRVRSRGAWQVRLGLCDYALI